MSDLIDEKSGHSIEEFLNSLAETIEWCSDTGNYSSYTQPLRTDSLRPDPLAGTRKAVVESVIRRRQFELQARRREIKERAEKGLRMLPRNQKGRLLVYEPDGNLSDGAAQVETYGFFDVNNVPPWDTWVASIVEDISHNYLVCWIPEFYSDLAQAGVRVNPEECIYWLDESDRKLKTIALNRK